MFVIKSSFQDKKRKRCGQLVWFASLCFASWCNILYSFIQTAAFALWHEIYYFSLIFCVAECCYRAEVNREIVWEYYVLISSDSQVLLCQQKTKHEFFVGRWRLLSSSVFTFKREHFDCTKCSGTHDVPFSGTYYYMCCIDVCDVA